VGGEYLVVALERQSPHRHGVQRWVEEVVDGQALIGQVSIRTAGHSGELLTDQRTLQVGFYAGIAMAFACLLICVGYFFLFERHANAAVDLALKYAGDKNLSDTQQWSLQIALTVHMYLARLQLLSCGTVCGMAFGFLGFALFLLGVRGNIDAKASGTGGLKMSVANLSPGAFVILCAAIVITICSTARLPVTFDTHSGPSIGAQIQAPTSASPVGHVDPSTP
jgi:hypothetical protein